MITDNMKNTIINFKTTEHLRDAIKKSAQRKGLTPSAFVREIVKKYIKYKEPDLI